MVNLTKALGGAMVTKTYQQISYFGDKVEVEEEDCFILSQIVLGTGSNGEIGIATSVGTGPLQRKFTKDMK